MRHPISTHSADLASGAGLISDLTGVCEDPAVQQKQRELELARRRRRILKLLRGYVQNGGKKLRRFDRFALLVDIAVGMRLLIGATAANAWFAGMFAPLLIVILGDFSALRYRIASTSSIEDIEENIRRRRRATVLNIFFIIVLVAHGMLLTFLRLGPPPMLLIFPISVKLLLNHFAERLSRIMISIHRELRRIIESRKKQIEKRKTALAPNTSTH